MKNTTVIEYEKPCEATGLGCVWVSREEFDDFGQMISWDSECAHCFRNRDWNKSEYVTEWLHP